MDFCYDGWTDRVPQKAPTSTLGFDHLFGHRGDQDPVSRHFREASRRSDEEICDGLDLRRVSFLAIVRYF